MLPEAERARRSKLVRRLRGGANANLIGWSFFVLFMAAIFVLATPTSLVERLMYPTILVGAMILNIVIFRVGVKLAIFGLKDAIEPRPKCSGSVFLATLYRIEPQTGRRKVDEGIGCLFEKSVAYRGLRYDLEVVYGLKHDDEMTTPVEVPIPLEQVDDAFARHVLYMTRPWYLRLLQRGRRG